MMFSEGDLGRLIVAIAFIFLAYTWVAYPMVLWLLRRFFTREIARRPLPVLPKVTIIIAVRNEEKKIAAKLMDCSSLDYPSDRLEILIFSDNSSDRTEE